MSSIVRKAFSVGVPAAVVSAIGYYSMQRWKKKETSLSIVATDISSVVTEQETSGEDLRSNNRAATESISRDHSHSSESGMGSDLSTCESETNIMTESIDMDCGSSEDSRESSEQSSSRTESMTSQEEEQVTEVLEKTSSQEVERGVEVTEKKKKRVLWSDMCESPLCSDDEETNSQMSGDSGKGESTGVTTPPHSSQGGDSDTLVRYEMNIPTSLCGAFIGHNGRNIQSLCRETGVSVKIIDKGAKKGCRKGIITGTADEVNLALESLRKRFSSEETDNNKPSTDCSYKKPETTKSHERKQRGSYKTVAQERDDDERQLSLGIMSYQIRFPWDLCGTLFSYKKDIQRVTGVDIWICRKFYMKGFRRVSIQGTQSSISEALSMLKECFPSHKYPTVSFKCINVPYIRPHKGLTTLSWMKMPKDCLVSVAVPYLVSVDRLFVQLISHDSYQELATLDQKLWCCYCEAGEEYSLQQPILANTLCVAPLMEGWYRAMVVQTYPEMGHCLVRYLDYGSLCFLKFSSLRQIRNDFTILPFQAVECRLDRISDLVSEGRVLGFGEEGMRYLSEIVTQHTVQAELAGYGQDGLPIINLYYQQGDEMHNVSHQLVVFHDTMLQKQADIEDDEGSQTDNKPQQSVLTLSSQSNPVSHQSDDEDDDDDDYTDSDDDDDDVIVQLDYNALRQPCDVPNDEMSEDEDSVNHDESSHSVTRGESPSRSVTQDELPRTMTRELGDSMTQESYDRVTRDESSRSETHESCDSLTHVVDRLEKLSCDNELDTVIDEQRECDVSSIKQYMSNNNVEL